ncbi:cysteine hydrolase family protein [Flavobacterium sp. 245]|uniref:cysteine hydrolase family protein n=1 Tax=Flavobacterium sp. 245 TaxID=2512115 RepID=UPI00105D98AF|nr:isochorismatase family cysteine hydrolase [Flavobacterium sp. 245]TDO96985.1 nicotinamidase-related amidase [Flavobacterium sp. 245]
MKTNQFGKTALILIDPYNDFLSEGGKLWDAVKQTVIENNVISNLIKLVDECRKNKIQIIYAPHRKTQKGDYLNWNFLSPSHMGSLKLTLFEKGSWGGEFHPDLQPQPEDLIAQNHWTASGFANTDLDFLLKQHSITHIVLAGMRANTCIDSTARYGVELGYHVTLIKDGIGAFNWDEIKATVETNFPNYGHSLLTTDEFITNLK